MVREPAADAFNVVVAPGGSIQAAIDGCRRGGFILLQPGTYQVKITIRIDYEVCTSSATAAAQ